MGSTLNSIPCSEEMVILTARGMLVLSTSSIPTHTRSGISSGTDVGSGMRCTLATAYR